MIQATRTMQVVLALSAVALSLWTPAGRADDGIERSKLLVAHLHETFREVMSGATQLGFEGRRTVLEPVLRESFDFPFMAEKSTGRYWRQFDAEQRKQLAEALAQLAVTMYASRLSADGGERFSIRGGEPAAFETILVRTTVAHKKGETTELDYRLRRDAAGIPRVVDVFLNGTVSELALRRAEYSSVLRRGGFASLLENLIEKTAKIRNEAGQLAADPHP